MCGISGGVWTHPSRRLSELELQSMTATLSHRGPDGQGIFWKEYSNGCGIALGHQRLSIIDIANGRQPMSNASKRLYVTFNGEIFNYLELRKTLEQAGYIFRTDSDTETIIHAYDAYGENFVDHLRGMFAIGLWDCRQQKLVLARDRLGEKPLVFCHVLGRLLFASEIKALKKIQGIGNQLNPASIDQYMRFGYVPHPWTAYEGIEKLPPGHIGVYQHNEWKVRRYWQPHLMTQDRTSFADACQILEHTMKESVKIRMRSDVPLGAFLSGGIDSSVVTGLMQQHTSIPIQTFSMAFSNSATAENQQAQQLSKQLGTVHHNLDLDIEGFEVLDNLVHCFDEPFADSSAIATYFLSRWTSSHVRVIMTGDGGDELFGGYARYHTLDRIDTFDRLPLQLRKLLTGPWLNHLPSFHPESRLEKLKHRLKVLRQASDSRYVHWLSLFSRYQREALYTPDYLRSSDFHETDQFLESLFRPYASERPSVQAMRADLFSYLPCDILAKIDITNMAHGLEGRSPFLDHKLVETVCQFPHHILLQPGLNKPLLSKTFSSFVSKRMTREPKVGFGLTENYWRRPGFISLGNDLLRSPDSFCRTFIRSDVIDRMLREHSTGYTDHGERLWSLLFLESWGKRLHENTPSSRGSVTQIDSQVISPSIAN